jgi:hypothetical protein
MGCIRMIEKMDWMLGMTENMMNISVKNMDKSMMPEMYSMTSAMMGNLNHMKMYGGIDEGHINLMEHMMRNMEMMMQNMDMMNDMQKSVMKSMMGYTVMMQMNLIMDLMDQR